MVQDIITKLSIIGIMAFLFGLERQLSNKPVGFGTFIFVSGGACSLGILATAISPIGGGIAIMGAVVTGIGFLGAGAILKSTDKVFGFTTAASIWIFSIIGLSIGLDKYEIGISTYILVLVVVMLDKKFETMGIGNHQRKVKIITNRIASKEEVIGLFGKNKWKLTHIDLVKKKKKGTFSYLLTAPRSYVKDLSQKMIESPWISEFTIE